MRLLMRFLVAALVVFSATPLRPVQAQATERGGTHDRCITQFYDRDMYNWYAYQNNCEYSISVQACGEERGGCWTMDPIRPGKKDNFGETREEIRAMGGVVAYVCRAGWIALDGSNEPISGGRHPYKCKNMHDGHEQQNVQDLRPRRATALQ